MSKFKEYWARQFGKPTGFGGKVSTFLMNRMNKAMYKAVEKQAPETGLCLDIGFGNGVLLKQLLKCTGAECYGVDISADMIKAAAKRNKKAIKNNRLTLAVGVAADIPFEKEFDLIYTVNTVYFWQNLHAGLQEIFSKLKTGGVFLNMIYGKEWYANKAGFVKYGFTIYDPEELKKAAEDNGFIAEVITIETGKSYAIKATKNGKEQSEA